MSADDDLDDLEAQLDHYDDDDDDDLPPIKRLWKKYKLIIIPAAAFLVFVPIILVSTGGSDKGKSKIVVIPELAPDPTGKIKMAPDSPAGGAATGGEDGVFSVVAEGKDEGKVVITAPPEEPKKPGDAAKDAPAAIAMTPEGGTKAPATIAMAPEGAEKTPKEIKSADGTILPPPTSPEKAGELAPQDLPAPGAPAPAGTTENILPVPGAEKPAEIAIQPAPKDTAAAPSGAEPVPTGSNEVKVLIPKGDEQKVAIIKQPDPAPTTQPKPSGSGVTPLRTMAGVYRIQVASARSEAAAKSLWGTQVKKYPDVLGDLPLTVQTAVVKDRGTFYRVQGGAFNNRESADSVCRKLKSRGQDCLVVRP